MKTNKDGAKVEKTVESDYIQQTTLKWLLNHLNIMKDLTQNGEESAIYQAQKNLQLQVENPIVIRES